MISVKCRQLPTRDARVSIGETREIVGAQTRVGAEKVICLTLDTIQRKGQEDLLQIRSGA